MNLYFRLILVLFLAFRRAKMTDILETGLLNFHVLPTDLDMNIHMNNGRYMTLMDLGRLDLIIRNGLIWLMIKRGYMPVLASAKIRFRLPLPPFQAYRLETEVVCWDDKWVFMEQRFVITKGKKAGAIAAIAIVKGGFFDRKTKTTVPTPELLSQLGMLQDSPPIPAHIIEWQRAEEALKTKTST